jgi:hypothetical protein
MCVRMHVRVCVLTIVLPHVCVHVGMWTKVCGYVVVSDPFVEISENTLANEPSNIIPSQGMHTRQL